MLKLFKPLKIDRQHAIHEGGEYRKLACLPPEPMLLSAAQRYGDSYPIITIDQLEDRDYEFYGSPKRNQKSHGSCAGHAGVTSLDTALRMIGYTPPLLSCTFPYALANGGQDNGSSLSVILQVLQKYGTCTEAMFNVDMIYQNQISQQAFAAAKQFEAVQAFLCRSFSELCSAIHLGYPVSLGIMVGDNFGQLDAEGVCPLPQRVLGGHALCGMGLKKSKRTGEPLIKFQNSWTPQWGLNGCAYLREAHFGQISDGWALVYPKEQAGNLPPLVPAA